MNKNYSLLLFLILFCNANAQTLLNEDCSTLTVGNVSTDPTGVLYGQGMWKTISFMGAAASTYTNSEFQVVNNNDAYGNTFQLTSNINNVGYRALTKNILTEWNSRTPGNNIVEVSFDMNTGPAVNSSGVLYVSLFNRTTNPDSNIELAAFSLEMDTKEITGLAFHTYAGGGETANITFHFGGTDALPQAVYLTPNTWYRLAFSFNYTTGEVIWKEANGLFYKSTMGAAAGTAVMQTDIGVAAISGNTPGIGLVDNINIRAVATGTLLNTNLFNNNDTVTTTISPNPSNGQFNIEASTAIKTIKIYNTLGKLITTQNCNSTHYELKNALLPEGIYLVDLELENGNSVMKKVVVKL